MTSTFKARYANGALTPLEPPDLAEGAEVTVSIAGGAVRVAETPATYDMRPRDADAEEGPLARIIAMVQEAHKEMPPDAWDDLPTDLAKNKKHYLYGHPKEEDDE